MICLALTALSFEENRKALDTYRPWIRMAELRVDRLRHDLVRQSGTFMNLANAELGIRFIVTLRLISDGGAWAHGETERHESMLAILESCQKGTVAYVDIEGETDWPDVEARVQELGAGIIRSYHNFSGTPANLVDIAHSLQARPNDVAKIAVMARGSIDLLAIFNLADQMRETGRPFIVLGMGPFGTPTRILAHWLGCLLTYASSALQGHVPAAPGHMDPQLLAEQFRYYEIQQTTRIFGIIGNPVMHSRSPGFHNPRFRDANLDAVYLHLQVDDLAAFFALSQRLSLQGVSVTIPHKEAVLPYLATSDELVHQIGACNTLIRRGSGWYGTNTDAPGFFHPLEGLLAGEQRNRAVVIGAGGAARAIVQALLAHGFAILLLNRTLDRATQMAKDFEGYYSGMLETATLPVAVRGQKPAVDADLVALVRNYAQLVVQTTSIGMQGEGEGEDPFYFHDFDGTEIVYDIIYTPPLTPILIRAQESGCRILNGWPMFEEQALLQSRLFIDAIKSR